ncbi:MAG: ECF-type sigma factor [Luteolibacter sp.]
MYFSQMDVYAEKAIDSSSTGGHSSDKLLPLVYEALRRLAAQCLSREWGSNQTLQPTALVHEVWLRVRSEDAALWKNEGHFFGAAAQAMRRILVERARYKSAAKRKAPPDVEIFQGDWYEHDDHILMVHDCLSSLEKTDPELANVILLKFYAGLNNGEIARISGKGVRTVERQWMFAKAKLYKLIVAEFKSESGSGV